MRHLQGTEHMLAGLLTALLLTARGIVVVTHADKATSALTVKEGPRVHPDSGSCTTGLGQRSRS